MIEFWDSRYATKEYIYGTKANNFIKENLDNIKPGKILFAAEGEGRNAAYAAQQGFEVYAFDASEVAKTKAQKLAEKIGVKINYKTATFQDVVYPENQFDVLVLIFAHMPPQSRTEWHRKLLRYLKKGGMLLLEGFTKDQLQYNSGGPKNLDMLYSEEELKYDFNELTHLEIATKTRVLYEGTHHRGKASVLQLIGKK